MQDLLVKYPDLAFVYTLERHARGAGGEHRRPPEQALHAAEELDGRTRPASASCRSTASSPTGARTGSCSRRSSTRREWSGYLFAQARGRPRARARRCPKTTKIDAFLVTPQNAACVAEDDQRHEEEDAGRSRSGRRCRLIAQDEVQLQGARQEHVVAPGGAGGAPPAPPALPWPPYDEPAPPPCCACGDREAVSGHASRSTASISSVDGGNDPRAARRERRRQVDAAQDPRRRLPARPRARSRSTASRPRSTARAARASTGSGSSTRSSACSRTSRSPRTSRSAVEPTHALADRRARAACDGLARRSDASGCAAIDPGRKVAELSLAERQLVEIAKVLTLQPPARADLRRADDRAQPPRRRAPLRDHARLRDDGVGVVFVSHRYREVLEICDVSTVLRNGRVVGRVARGRGHARAARRADAGAEGRGGLPPRLARAGRTRSSCSRRAGCASACACRDVDLQVRRGEIVGVCGLLGLGTGRGRARRFGDARDVSGALLLRARQPGTALAARGGRRPASR